MITLITIPRPEAEAVPVRRCLWCKNRTGAARYWDGDEWIHMINPIHYFGSAYFTDGLCDDCAATELAKLINDNESNYESDTQHPGRTA